MVAGPRDRLPRALSGGACRAAPRRYALDPAGSRLEIQVGKTGLFGFAGHEHQVLAGRLRAAPRSPRRGSPPRPSI